MIAGAAGCGKSALAQWYAMHLPLPVLYFSGDTDDVTMAERGAAMVTGHKQEWVREAEEPRLSYYLDELEARSKHIDWEWDGDLGYAEIEDAVNAVGLVRGEWPALIVFDVLMSFTGSNHEVQIDFLNGCKSLASKTNAHVMVLHHTVGSVTDNPHAPKRSDISNKLDQFPATIVTLGREESVWNVALVKSRTSKADPRAERPWRVRVDFDTMSVLG